MTGPFAETSIVLEMETGNPEQYLRVTPDRPNGDRWLHRVDEFDPALSRAAVVDRYALPASDSYTVDIVEVPAGESLRIGDVADSDGQAPGGDLVELCEHDTVPETWIRETTTLEALLE